MFRLFRHRTETISLPRLVRLHASALNPIVIDTVTGLLAVWPTNVVFVPQCLIWFGLISYADLPAQLAQAIAEAKPISSVARSISEAVPEFVSTLNSEICRIVDMSQADSRALDLGA